MKKFLVLYLMPSAGMEAWMQLDPAVRQADEDKMKAEWDVWMKEHQNAIKETAGAGKTQRLTKDGVETIKNDIMLFSLVEAESEEAVAEMFKNHPHFQIPDASIEIMPANYMAGME